MRPSRDLIKVKNPDSPAMRRVREPMKLPAPVDSVGGIRLECAAGLDTSQSRRRLAGRGQSRDVEREISQVQSDDRLDSVLRNMRRNVERALSNAGRGRYLLPGF
jgi:hypothetical protein